MLVYMKTLYHHIGQPFKNTKTKIILALCLAVMTCGLQTADKQFQSSEPMSEQVQVPVCPKNSPAQPIFSEKPIEGTLPQKSLSMDISDYPVVGGAAPLLPLCQALMAAVTGVDYDSIDNKTTQFNDDRFFSLSDNIGLLLRYAPSERFTNDLKESGVEIEIKEIARDALVFVVNKDNPVKSLSVEQLAGVYSGRIGNWDALGGNKTAVEAFQKESESTNQGLLKKLVMRGAELMEPANMQTEYYHGSSYDNYIGYTNSAGAIGYSMYYYVKNMLQNKDVRMLGVDGIECSSASIRDGTYPLSTGIYAIIRKSEPEDSPVRKLFNFLSGTEGAKLIESCGYVSKYGEYTDADHYTAPVFDEPVSVGTASAPVFPVFINGKYGFMDINGQLAAEPKYDQVVCFNLYSPNTEEDFSVIPSPYFYSCYMDNPKGYNIPAYYKAYIYSESTDGPIIQWQVDSSYLVDTDGKVIYSDHDLFDAYLTDDGYFVISYSGSDKSAVLLDKNGRQIIPSTPDECYSYLDPKLYGGKWRIAKSANGGFCILDLEGKPITCLHGDFTGFLDNAFYVSYGDTETFNLDFPDLAITGGAAVKVSADGSLLRCFDGITYFAWNTNDNTLIPSFNYLADNSQTYGFLDADLHIMEDPVILQYLRNNETGVIYAVYDADQKTYLADSSGGKISDVPYNDIYPVQYDSGTTYFWAELTDGGQVIIDGDGNVIMNIPVGYSLNDGRSIYSGLAIVSTTLFQDTFPAGYGAFYISAINDGKVNPDGWILPPEYNDIGYVNDNYLTTDIYTNDINENNSIFDLHSKQFLIKNMRLIHLVYSSGSRTLFYAETGRCRGYLNETGQWIYRTSIYDRLSMGD